MFDCKARPVVVMRALPTGRFRLVRLIASRATRVFGSGMPGGEVVRENTRWP